MPRKHRIWFPGAIYHVTARGNWKQDIFRTKEDYVHYFSLIQSVQERKPFLIHSYCLMPNHIHILLRNDKPSFKPNSTTYSLCIC
ncbi:transposase [Rossellomorea sp. BNER]|uniref:transposase n=1 Tax=Rossellomorea sp. BNER TaxID=2962031 RepID=UPI003AF256F0